jgi:hypothetical protein
MHRLPSPTPRLSRRRFLQIVGVTGLSALGSAILHAPPFQRLGAFAVRRGELDYWSDPLTWGGKVPGKNDLVIVSKRIVLDVDARVRGLIIKSKGQLTFHPRRDIALRSRGNVVVRGQLTIRPQRADIVHRLVFPEVVESRFIGGGKRVISSDVGLWVTHKGAINVAGSPKLAWSRTVAGIPGGTDSITLQHEPIGWRVGDEIVLTPTLSPTQSNHDSAYDVATVAAVDKVARRITLSSPTAFEHPAVEIEPGVVLTPEVLNLTRNVRIEGSSRGRTHVWIRSSRRQNIRHASFQHTGPRKPLQDAYLYSEPIQGRYAIHFHMMGQASRGSTVRGVVVRDSGNHAFVSHLSHGITFRDCVSHNTFEEAYWWDPSPQFDHPHLAPPTDDVLYERCVASMVKSDPPTESYQRLGGFFIGARKGNAIRNCVAVGVQGGADSCGFLWPEKSLGLWKFENCIAHNNRSNGITAWQVTELPNVISRFSAYHNGRFGILHGFYSNGFLYKDSILYANGYGSVAAIAVSRKHASQTFSGLRCDQAGLSDYCVVTSQRVLLPEAPVNFIDCRFRGYRKAAFGLVDPAPFPHFLSIQSCTFEANEFWLGSDIYPTSRVRVNHPMEGLITLRRADQPGEFQPAWNASVSRIS